MLTSEQIECLLSEIEKRTATPAVKISIEEADDLPLCASKFGGVPYWNVQEPYPTDDNGDKLALLAQINCKELPALPDFPQQGLLQFFILPSDFDQGLDFNDQTLQNGWRIVYQQNIDTEITEDDVLALGIPCVPHTIDDGDFAVDTQYQLSFKLTETYMGAKDFAFREVLQSAAQAVGIVLGEDEINNPYKIFGVKLYENLEKHNQGHWIGGYPFFTQEDPRIDDEEYQEHSVLLLQIDSDKGIEWCDSGVANFLIKPDDLRKRDFSKVFYNWDCF